MPEAVGYFAIFGYGFMFLVLCVLLVIGVGKNAGSHDE